MEILAWLSHGPIKILHSGARGRMHYKQVRVFVVQKNKHFAKSRSLRQVCTASAEAILIEWCRALVRLAWQGPWPWLSSPCALSPVCGSWA